jgi:hypothetical protein
MIRKTTKAQMRWHLRKVRLQAKRLLIKGHYRKYRYTRNWIKAHAALLKEVG